MYSATKAFIFVSIAMAACGCATTAPRYSTNYGAVSTLKAASLAPVKVGEIKKGSASKKAESLTIRGGTFSSPYGSFSAYLREALKNDLDHAELLSEQSATQIDGVLIRNELDASGFETAFAEIEARLTVSHGGMIAYDATKSARHEWPSNFVGMVAIPRAIESYPFVMRKVLAEFYADPKFLAALKRR